ncbi:MAG: hypothetical protein IJM62_02370 [Lachnospiraceae bacterium]|nr:hypothetical protein [Lachnospiraceae bacterium]
MLIVIMLVAVIAEFAVAIAVQELAVVGAVFLTLAVFTFLMLYKNREKNRNTSQALLKILAVYWAVWGLITLLSPLFRDRFRDPGIVTQLILFIGLSLLVALVGAYLGIVKPLRCSTPVLALYAGAVRVGASGIRNPKFSPRFTYEFEGSEYTSEAADIYNEKVLENTFRDDRSYEIFIDPKNPEDILVKRAPAVSDLFILVAGLIMFVFSIIMVFA